MKWKYKSLNNDPTLKWEITSNMKTYGGSFVKALAKCIELADVYNMQKIEYAFGDYLYKYHPDQWEKQN